MKCVLGEVDERALSAGFQAFADIDALLDALRREKIQSLFVEGGSTTLQSFIERDLWDEVWEERSPVVLESGVPAPTMPREFEARVEHHFGRTYRHWESPVLQSTMWISKSYIPTPHYEIYKAPHTSFHFR